MTGQALTALLLPAAGHTHHTTPTGWFLVVLLLLVVLYVLWRSGRLGKLLGAVGERRAGGSRPGLLPEGVRLRPLSLLPLAVLLIVVVVLVVAH